MKSVILLCALTVGVMVVGQSVFDPCPPGERYRPDCPKVYEPTCRHPRRDIPFPGRHCEKPLCFCDEPTIRDERSNACVLSKDCIWLN